MLVVLLLELNSVKLEILLLIPNLCKQMCILDQDIINITKIAQVKSLNQLIMEVDFVINYSLKIQVENFK